MNAVTNVFNTHGEAGRCALDPATVQARLSSDLLFTKHIFAPGPSLLCSRWTRHILQADPLFLEQFIRAGRIVPVLTHEHPSFQDLLANLKARNAAAIDGLDPILLADIASSLDSLADTSMIHLVDQKDLDTAKTSLGERIVATLPEILLPTRTHAEQIKTMFEKQKASQGVVTGTWWSHLGNSDLLNLPSHDASLTELGSMIFDFAYSDCVETALVGHEYARCLSSAASLAESVMPKCTIHIDPAAFQCGMEDGDILNPGFWAKLGFNDLNSLLKDIGSARNKFFEAIEQATKDPTKSHILEARERLHEYLVEIARTKRSSRLGNFAQSVAAKRRTKVQISVWQSVRTVFFGLSVSMVASQVVNPALPTTPRLLLLLSATPVAMAVHIGISNALELMKREQGSQLGIVDTTVPASVQFSRKKS